MSIGSRIKERRNELKITQEELAKQIGVTKGAIANYENEVSKPKIELMYKLFEALDCDANYLHQDDMLAGAYSNKATPKEFEDIIKKYRKLDKAGQELVNVVIDKEVERVEKYGLLKENISNAHTSSTKSIIHIKDLVSAGTGKFILDDLPPELIEIPDIPKYKNVNYAITVKGDSMEDKFYDGDIALVEKGGDVEYGDIGIFVIDSEGYIKKCTPDGLESLNKKYKTIKPTSEVVCMGKVVGRL